MQFVRPVRYSMVYCIEEVCAVSIYCPQINCTNMTHYVQRQFRVLARLNVGPLLYLCGSSHVPLLYISCPHVVLV